MIDIFGAIDLPEVIATAEKKVAVARKAGNKKYSQIKIEGADHFFNNKEEELIKRIRGWLKTNAAGKEILEKK